MRLHSVLGALVTLASLVSANFSNCGKSRDDFQVHSISYAPNPPKAGQDVCITLEGDLKKAVVNDTELHLEAFVGFFHVYSNTTSLCNILVDSPNPCPILPSSANTSTVLEYCARIPAKAPTGLTVNFKISATDNGTNVFCVQGPLMLTK